MSPDRALATYLQASLFRASDRDASRATIVRALHATGSVDVGRLEDAARTVVARHESCSSRFVEASGEVWQVSGSPESVPVQRRTVGADADPFEAIRDVAAQSMAIDAHQPLMRIVIVDCGASGAYVVVVGHHLITDGASMAVLLSDLVQAYATAGRLPPRASGDVIRSRIARQASPVALSEAWRQRLADSRTSLPRMREGRAEWRRQAVATRIGAREVRASMARTRAMLPSLVLGAAVVAVSARYRIGGRFTAGMMVSNRRPDQEDAVGFLADLMPCPVATGPSLRAAITSAEAAVIQCIADPAPLDDLVELLEPPRNGRVFDLVVNCQHVAPAGRPGADTDAVRFAPVPVPHDWGQHGPDPWWAGHGAVMVAAEHDGDGCTVRVTTDWHIDAEPDRIGAAIGDLIASAAQAAPDAREVGDQWTT